MRPSEGSTVPVLETARLRLRGHRRDDLAAGLALWSDPVVVRSIGGTSATGEAVWSRLLRYRGLWALLGYGYWAIEERAGGGFVGELGFADFRRTIEPSIDGIPELGWALDSRVHGRGYATEAVRAALRWADIHLEIGRTVCIIAPDNVASLRVAHKGGYCERVRTTYHNAPAIMFERQRAAEMPPPSG